MKVFSIILLIVAVICSVQGSKSEEKFRINEKEEWPVAVENVDRVHKFIHNVLTDDKYNPSEETLNGLRIAGPETHPDLKTNEETLRVVTLEGAPESIIEEEN